MDNLLESNERTLVMFDSVCSGLSSCLALVHADIKQMTEHRNKLAQLEQEHIQAKLIPAQEIVVVTNNNEQNIKSKRKKQQQACGGETLDTSNKLDDDPHHLAGLKLLDKRLADSFSQAFRLNDLQKSSIAAKQQAVNHSRPSIFQVLLGKASKNYYNNNNNANVDLNKKNTNKNEKRADVGSEQVDNKMIIDDINRQTRLAMQYSKQLEAHLFKVEDLRAKYEMHLKMGLVVKSVARAYLTTNGSPHSPSSLARHQLCSSLILNDSSSIGTHSSLSSLNLSTWSSSRSKATNKRRSAATNNESTLNYYNNNNNNQMFVSTISLNNKHNKRLNLAKLISSSTTRSNQQDHPNYADPQTMMNLKRQVSSQSIEPPCVSNYSTAHTDWTIPESPPYGMIKSDTMSKSHVNLRKSASHSSLKGNKAKNQEAAAASKTTIKEFIENIDKIESDFESFMGSFLLAVEDIQGFARVCQGDVFEITIKYGAAQKFKTKISVLKDNRQKCDNRQTVFKARIADVFAIKAYECKGLGKRVLLGHKLCETRDLFTARSQLMTISLNQTGSIKLNLIVTWNPLHLAPNSSSAAPGLDISHISLPPTPVSSSTLSSLSSVPSLNGATTTINIRSHQRIKSSPSFANHQHRNQHYHHLQQQQQQHESMYQTVEPTYGYYIPPPDYLTNDLKY